MSGFRRFNKYGEAICEKCDRTTSVRYSAYRELPCWWCGTQFFAVPPGYVAPLPPLESEVQFLTLPEDIKGIGADTDLSPLAPGGGGGGEGTGKAVSIVIGGEPFTPQDVAQLVADLNEAIGLGEEEIIEARLSNTPPQNRMYLVSPLELVRAVSEVLFRKLQSEITMREAEEMLQLARYMTPHRIYTGAPL